MEASKWILLLCFAALNYAERIYQSASTGRRYTSDLGRVRSDPNDQYVRIQAEILKLINDKGLTSTNAYCDTFGACDPICYAHLDTDRPNAEWPGGVLTQYWPEVFKADNVNSPNISKLISRDSCAKPYRDAVLRVFCEDYDPASSNDLINQWECPISRTPSESEVTAKWTQIEDCVPKFQPGGANNIRLTFRYRVYQIPRTICDSSPILTTPRPTTRKA